VATWPYSVARLRRFRSTRTSSSLAGKEKNEQIEGGLLCVQR
jgi:hypothetical protein